MGRFGPSVEPFSRRAVLVISHDYHHYYYYYYYYYYSVLRWFNLLTARVRRSPGEVCKAAGDTEVRKAREKITDNWVSVRVVGGRVGRRDTVRLNTSLIQVLRTHLHHTRNQQHLWLDARKYMTKAGWRLTRHASSCRRNESLQASDWREVSNTMCNVNNWRTRSVLSYWCSYNKTHFDNFKIRQFLASLFSV